MSVTKNVNLAGRARFSTLRVPDEKYGFYGVNLFLTDKSWEKFREMEAALKVRQDKKTGENYIVLRRAGDATDQDGKALGPVPIYDKDRKSVEDVFNDARIVCNVDFYTTKVGRVGHRLNFVVVHEQGKPLSDRAKNTKEAYAEYDDIDEDAPF